MLEFSLRLKNKISQLTKKELKVIMTKKLYILFLFLIIVSGSNLSGQCSNEDIEQTILNQVESDMVAINSDLKSILSYKHNSLYTERKEKNDLIAQLKSDYFTDDALVYVRLYWAKKDRPVEVSQYLKNLVRYSTTGNLNIEFVGAIPATATMQIIDTANNSTINGKNNYELMLDIFQKYTNCKTEQSCYKDYTLKRFKFKIKFDTSVCVVDDLKIKAVTVVDVSRKLTKDFKQYIEELQEFKYYW
jgi:hypothetical protein